MLPARSRQSSHTPGASDRILIFGGSPRTLDLLRLATIRSDDVVLIGRDWDAAVERYAGQFAIELQTPAEADGHMPEASAILVSIGDVEAENRIVREARRSAVPVYVADRVLVSDFTLIEFLEQRPHTTTMVA